MDYKKDRLLTEGEILGLLQERKDLFFPLKIKSIIGEPAAVGNYRADAQIALSWRNNAASFLAEFKSRTSPRLAEEAIQQLKRLIINNQALNPLLVVPFLSKTIVSRIEQEEISGIDLNGNYLIQTPQMLAIRLDRKNEFPESQPIKKIFSGNSSIAARVFLAAKRKRFESVKEIYSTIENLGGGLSLSAISKVLKGLEDELIIGREGGGISLLQPEKLLDRLRDDYRPPKILATLRIKLPAPGAVSIQDFNRLLQPPGRWVLDGEGSIERYNISARAEAPEAYVTDLTPFMPMENERFFNATLKKTLDSFPYFDRREGNGVSWVSPIQCYLELSQMGKRERELVEPIRQSILEGLK